jgi:hypothetical protein|tara:strand:- start:317 stop:910 length:594 start_codon:yes stop_codon:yes gene_type:complete
MTNPFFSAAKKELDDAKAGEKDIGSIRATVETSKVYSIAYLSVYALDGELKAIDLRKKLEAAGQKEAKAKILAENAVKFHQHPEFQATVERARTDIGEDWSDVGTYSQEIKAALDGLEITTQSKLIALLNPKQELTAAQELAVAALKFCGVRKNKIKIKARSVTSVNEVAIVPTKADREAAKLLLDAVKLVYPDVLK